MRVLVPGASVCAGSVLVPRLLAGGHDVRALGRDPARVHAALTRGRPPGTLAEIEVIRGDALTGEGLARALSGVEVAYYLIHSMERSAAGSEAFSARQRIA